MHLIRFLDIPYHQKFNIINNIFHTKLIQSILDNKTFCHDEEKITKYVKKTIEKIHLCHPLYSYCMLDDEKTFYNMIMCFNLESIKFLFQTVLDKNINEQWFHIKWNCHKEVLFLFGYKEKECNYSDVLLKEIVNRIDKNTNIEQIELFTIFDGDIKDLFKIPNMYESDLLQLLKPKTNEIVRYLKHLSDEIYTDVIDIFKSDRENIILEFTSDVNIPIGLLDKDNKYNRDLYKGKRENLDEIIRGIDSICESFSTDPCLFYILTGRIMPPERIDLSKETEETVRIVQNTIITELASSTFAYSNNGYCLVVKSDSGLVMGELTFQIYDSRKIIDDDEMAYFINIKKGVWRNKYMNVSTLLRNLIAEPHYGKVRTQFMGEGEYIYIRMIAILSEGQGKGYGGVLLRSILKYADYFGLKTILETHKDENVRFYEKFGFVNSNVDQGWSYFKLPKCYLMIRQPQTN